jgi:rare lipoprotein A
MNAHRLLVIAAVLPTLALGAKPLDHSGQPQVGTASYYANFFAGRKMANGEPMRPHSNNAASRSLPLGTTARVTNLENGRSAVVEIKDRGPYVKGRIVDLSPSTARALGMLRQGVAPVEVVPLTVPQPDGSVKTLPSQQATEAG